MPYYDNYWHTDAHENIPSPACFIVFVKLKTENQLIRLQAASDWNVGIDIQQLVSLIRRLTYLHK